MRGACLRVLAKLTKTNQKPFFARHELQAIRGKLADELDEHRTALDIDIEKVTKD